MMLDFLFKKRKSSKKAVAPIIATLLMVAIAVVGGILIFVFGQGFFTDTQIQGPTIDSLQIFGYDARDDGSIGSPACSNAIDRASHTGLCILSTSPAASADLTEDDDIALFIRNTGAGTVVIDSITVRSQAYTAVQTGTTTAIAAPADTQFCITAVLPSVNGAGTCLPAVIPSGSERTMLIGYDSTAEGDVKLGRPLLIKLNTGNGATFTINVRNGISTSSGPGGSAGT